MWTLTDAMYKAMTPTIPILWSIIVIVSLTTFYKWMTTEPVDVDNKIEL